MFSKTGFLRTRLTAILWVMAALTIGCALLVPSADAILKGRHKPVQVFRTISSNGRYEVTTSSRVALPANGVMDPAIIATFAVKELGGGREHASTEVKVDKESDLQNPLVRWKDGEIQISAFDASRERRSVLRAPGGKGG